MDTEYILERYGRNGKLFLLTRDHPIEITTVGGGYGDVDMYEKGSLFHYANQVLIVNDNVPDEESDRFGRNYLDRMFIALCIEIFTFVMAIRYNFKSLACKKEGDKFIARVQYDNEDLEMEVVEMFHYFRGKK